jgi:hypothetical protein
MASLEEILEAMDSENLQTSIPPNPVEYLNPGPSVTLSSLKDPWFPQVWLIKQLC